MAIAVVSTSSTNTFNAAAVSTFTLSSNANNTLFLTLLTTGTTVPTFSSVTDTGRTWNLITQISSAHQTIAVYWSFNSTNVTSSTVTITRSNGGANTGLIRSITTMSGVNGTTAVRQFWTTTSAAAQSISASTSTAILANNACFCSIGAEHAVGVVPRPLTPRSGWSEADELSPGGNGSQPVILVETQYILAGDQTASATQTSAPADNEYALIAFEINDANNITVFPNSIASEEAFGTPTMALVASPDSIASAEAFGTAGEGYTVFPNGIPSAESFGSPTLDLIVQVDSIPSAEAFGQVSILIIKNRKPIRIVTQALANRRGRWHIIRYY